MKEIAKKVLLTCGRSYITLDNARNLRDSGCDVYVAETSEKHVCYYSNAVTKNFLVTSPHTSAEKFIQDLVAIVETYKIDYLIPTWEEVFYLSRALAKFPKSCTVFCMPFETLEILHNKWKFVQWMQQHHFITPKSVLITNRDDLKKINLPFPYALKACYCRASQAVYKITEKSKLPPITPTPENPWIAQEWIEGNRYCSYSICHNGRLNAVSLYPVEYTIKGTSCLTFRHVAHQKIFLWIERCVRELNYTGQIGFDFIETAKGDLYVVDSNPRATCGLHLFDAQDNIAGAFFDLNSNTLYPRGDMKKEIAIGMLLYGWEQQSHTHNSSFKQYLNTLFSYKDVIFSSSDPKPFFMMPCLFTNYWLNSRKVKQPLYACFYSDIEWNNESR